nr:hypothetical protein FVER53263_14065 [Fusarium verticillioides]
MTDKKSKPRKVDFICRGREFGRFIRAHRNPANSYGFDKTDAAWIKKYFPESGADDNEREYDKKWVTNPVSLSTTRSHWRKRIQELDNQEASPAETFDPENLFTSPRSVGVPRYAQQTAASSSKNPVTPPKTRTSDTGQAAASSDGMSGAFPDNPIIQRPQETANAVNIVAPKPLRSRTLTEEWIQPGDEPELQGLQELDKATDHPVLGSEYHQTAPLAHGLEPHDNASAVFENQLRHATTHIPLNETYLAKATWRTLNDQQHPSNLMAQSGSLTDRMDKDTKTQDHQSSRAASAMPATSWNQASLEISQTNPPARQGPIVFSPQTDSRVVPRGSRLPPAPKNQEAAPYWVEMPQRSIPTAHHTDPPSFQLRQRHHINPQDFTSTLSTSTHGQESQHLPLVQWYIEHRRANPHIIIPSTATQEIVNSLNSGPQGTGTLEKRDSL